MELKCAVQKYAWGKVGKSSLVAQLSEANSGTVIDENERYAELWMGTHPSGPSRITNSNELLSDHILKNSNSLGEEEKKRFGPQLPFLFKSLSVAKALSIQAHPNKVTSYHNKNLQGNHQTYCFDFVNFFRNMLKNCLLRDLMCTKTLIINPKWLLLGVDLLKHYADFDL